ncbi:MAG TPA: ATP-binding protein [Steroidobacteraceae bacterium]|nr:ATP-binding protein [Steroidobacteraceae bacterium]
MKSEGSARTLGERARLSLERRLDREPTRAELIESNAHLQLLLSSVAQAVWETDADGTVVVDSPSWRAYTGQSRTEWLGDGWADAIHPDDRAYALGLWREAVRTRSVVNAEFRLRHATSGWRWTNVRAAPVFAADGTLVKWVGLNIDIDARKQAEAERRAAEDRQALLLRLSDELRSLDDADALQRTACRLLGEHLRADGVHYGEVRAEDGVVVVGPGYDGDGARSLTGTYPFDSFRDTPRLLEGRTIAVGDVATSADLSETARRTCRALQIASFVTAPLVLDGKLAWTLSVLSRTPRAWTKDEVSLVREAGERTWAEVERARAQSALAQANRRKDEFLATLAHELRNPLAPIRNGLQIARLSSRNDVTLQRIVEMMDRQLAHLARLVDDLLDIARISAGKIALQRKAVDLVDVIARSIESVRTLIDEHGHALEVEAPAGAVIVDGDPQRLAQVFTNLLSNAAKYTERGGRVQVRVEATPDEAVVQVIDTGIGIPPEELQQVFDLFSQVRLHHVRAEGGLGIGLALVRRLVEMHGGSVAAHSEGPGRGSTLTVRLPRVQVEPTVARAGPVAEPPPAVRGCRVVVADDNVDAAESLGVLLRLEGHAVTVVHDGEAAVAAARDRRPDAVILDLGMPGVDGLEAARRIRALPECVATRLIALTGWGQDADRERTRAAGFDHHLVKPADPALVAELLGTRGD